MSTAEEQVIPAVSEVPSIAVSDLAVSLRNGRSVVREVSFELRGGQTLGLVGESGSGKTTTGFALLGYTRPGMQIVGGTLQAGALTVELADERRMRELRGRVIAHVPQDPAASLNPALRIGGSLADVIPRSTHARQAEAVLEALERVHLPATPQFVRRFPHQVSGGQQQRVLIAMALAREPRLLVLDEPTTGLDVVTQARVLAEIKRLHRERGTTMIYISHDLAVVSQVADEIAVMYAGHVVERGPAARVLSRPAHPYTRGLVASIPDHAAPRHLLGIPGVAVGVDDRPVGCAFAPRCGQRVARCEVEDPPPHSLGDAGEVRCFEAERTPPLELAAIRAAKSEGPRAPLLTVEHLSAHHRGAHDDVLAVNDVSFVVTAGECVALAGESGSGKTTTARVVAGLHAPSEGSILLGDQVLAARAKNRPLEHRRRCQIIFQNPYESLNPRRRVLDEVARPAHTLRNLSRAKAREEAFAVLERVRLSSRLAHRFASELSGGERQRVAIARALAAGPELLICDEITSALDVSVQAAILDLLGELQRELHLSLLFITHNLGVVAAIADRVIVLHDGEVCEEGPVATVFSAPRSQRTKELLEAAPRLLLGGG